MNRMRRWLLSVALSVFTQFILSQFAQVWAQGQPVTFSAFGDIPYGTSEYPVLQQFVSDHNRYSPSAFIIHIGDMLSGSCLESKYADVANIMKGLAVPAYFVVGDNEYSDCDDPVQALVLWKKYFLNFQNNFCGAPFTENQSVRPENLAFVVDGVLFIGIHLVGGSVHDQSEWNIRMQDDVNWVSQQFQGKAAQVRAAVIFAQTGKRASVEAFTVPFRAAAAAFAKPVLYIHGDLHTFKYDQPWPEKNITRLEVPKGAAEPPLEVTVTMTTNPPQNAFTVKRNPWGSTPFNMPPCVNAGADQTIAGLSTTLQGGATDDGDPTGAFTTAWSMVSGPGTTTFGNASALTTTANFSTGGTYVLRLTAADGQLQKSDEVTIIVQSAGPSAALAINDVQVNEGNTGTVAAIFTVSLANPSGQTVTVNYQTADGSATAGSDYQAASGTLTFLNGTTTQTIAVMVQGDVTVEPNETFFVNLSNASNAILSDAQGMGTILNDDAALAPVVSAFGPPNGAAGTLVTLSGSKFTGATSVTFNGTPATFGVDSDAQISTTVPTGASTGPIRVTNTYGTGSSATNFVVPPSPPTILSFAPASGPAGTVVMISGNGFAGATAVAFNGASAVFTIVSNTQLQATVPAGASTGKISVTNSIGLVNSSADFVVKYPPAIASFTPASGPAATQVTITGSNFTGTTAVTFNGTAAGFSVNSSTQIKATVSAGTATGKISVTNADGTTQSAAEFVVKTPPAITSFSPVLGPAGTEVTITGSAFLGTSSVRFSGNEAATILVDSDSQIRAWVAAGATPGTGKIVVTNTAGSATSAGDFTITSAPVTFTFTPQHDAYINSSSPSSNYGAASTVRGKLSSSEINHAYFKFEITGLSGTLSSAKLRVYVSSASPDGGAVYTVASTYFASATPWIEGGLTWNNAPGISGSVLSSVGAVSSGQWVEFEVTTAISGNGTHSFGLKNNDANSVYYRSKEYGSATAPQLIIQCLPSNAPSLAAFAPSSGPGGAVVTISGSKFTGTTSVTFNGKAATFITDSDTQIRATVPVGASSGKIRVTNSSGTTPSAADFIVTTLPVIASFSPAIATGGSEVTITGNSFTGMTSVAFNGIPATSFVFDSDLQIRAIVPASAAPGKGKIAVTNSAGTGVSAADFTIASAPLTYTFAPVQDAYVKLSNPTNNYGSASTLRVRSSSSETLHSYLKFEVTGLLGTLLSAKLRLYVSDSGPDGGALYLVSNNYKNSALPWQENGITWNNAPDFAGSALSAVGAASSGQWLEWEVTPVLVGNGVYSFALKNNHSDAVYFHSEEGANDPQLVIQSVSSGAPSIASFAPALGPVGSEVTITGNSLIGTTGVTFNGTPALFTVDSDTKIRATVPAGATAGRIRITNAQGSGSHAIDFLVAVQPALASFAPATGAEGTEVIITGSHFISTNSVSFNGKTATSFVVDSDSQIRALVPAGATPGAGKIVVTNPAGSATSTADFTINLLFSFTPLYDVYVKSSSPSSNYGSAGTLRGKLSSSEINHSYLKFAVTGLSGALVRARLRLYVSDASPHGGTVHLVSNNYGGSTTPWVESGMNWNNAPGITTAALSGMGAVSVGQWVEFEVTPVIAGDGVYSFGLKNDNSNAVYFHSKEAANDPLLIIETASAAVAKSAGSASDPNAPQGEDLALTVPGEFMLYQNYPNPFNPSTNLRFGVPHEAHVAIKLYSVDGREVRTLVDQNYPAGMHLVTFMLGDLPSGTYFYVMQSGAVRKVRQLLLIR